MSDPVNNQPATPPSRPDNVPEKFWDAQKGVVNTEALLRSYSELERMRSNPPATPPAPPAPTNNKIDTAAIDAELAQGGQLSEATYQKYEAQGVPRDMLDRYVSGLNAEVTAFKSKVFEAVGGEGSFDAMRSWAAANLPKAEIEAFNDALTGSVEQALLAVHGLKARYEATNGALPKLLGGGGRPGADTYNSWAEVTTAMRDARYETDPAYRKTVEDKLNRSNLG